MVDLVFQSKRPVSVEALNDSLLSASTGAMKGVLGFTLAPLVSSDLIGNPNSAIVDGLSTQVMGSHLAKILAWYDNEWGFSNRMIDLTETIAALG
jgi:glyceraldehyde 3-phosphate dehydrogenase